MAVKCPQKGEVAAVGPAVGVDEEDEVVGTGEDTGIGPGSATPRRYAAAVRSASDPAPGRGPGRSTPLA